MLLRRMIDHVRKQEWTAVILDFMIVVTGILIAFQITNWSETRADRRDEKRYLAELAVNLEADRTQARNGQEASLQRLAAAEAILAGAAPDYDRPPFFVQINRDLPTPGAFAEYPYAYLASYSFMVSAENTFDELIQTGNIGVLSNRSLVTKLTRYYDRMDRQRGDDVLILSQAEGMLDWVRENGLGMADRAGLEETVALAQADDTFLGFVKMASFLAYWQYNSFASIENDADALLAAVEAEMETR